MRLWAYCICMILFKAGSSALLHLKFQQSLLRNNALKNYLRIKRRDGEALRR